MKKRRRITREAVQDVMEGVAAADLVLKVEGTSGLQSSELHGITGIVETASPFQQNQPEERRFARIPVRLRNGEGVTFLLCRRNSLIKLVIEEFCSRFTPGATVLYIEDAAQELLHLDAVYLENLDVAIAPSAKMPDVIVHD